MKKFLLLIIFIFFALLLAGCSSKPDNTNSDTGGKKPLVVKPECEIERDKLIQQCNESDLGELTVGALIECTVIEIHEEEFLDHCDDEAKININYMVWKIVRDLKDTKQESVYNDKLENKCKNTPLGDLSLEEVDTCCAAFNFPYICPLGES